MICVKCVLNYEIFFFIAIGLVCGASNFSARLVGIFVTDSELPYTLELAQPAIEIAIEKVNKCM